MAEAFDLADDAKRALREAENFCWRANVAIVAPEHLLAGVLAVLAPRDGLPEAAQVEAALLATQGAGSGQLTDNVMFGSAAREAINHAVRVSREAGVARLDAAGLGVAVIDSGELSPMVYAALGVERSVLRSKLEVRS